VGGALLKEQKIFFSCRLLISQCKVFMTSAASINCIRYNQNL